MRRINPDRSIAVGRMKTFSSHHAHHLKKKYIFFLPDFVNTTQYNSLLCCSWPIGASTNQFDIIRINKETTCLTTKATAESNRNVTRRQ